MPTGKGLPKSVSALREIGGNALQVFTSNPRSWSGKPVSPEAAEAFRAAVAGADVEVALASHDTYLVNLCAESEEIVAKSRAALIEELTRCDALGIPVAVSHIGARMSRSDEEAEALAVEGILHVLDRAPGSACLLMETTAGQGSSLNADLGQIGRIMKAAGGPERLGVCLDTCHVFAAGYDIRTEAGWRSLLDEFESEIGLDRLRLIHVNDSQKPLGSRKDRHAHIGQGEIGMECFEILVNLVELENVPMTLETPDAETSHGANLATLQGLRRGSA